MGFRRAPKPQRKLPMNLTKAWNCLEPHERFKELLDDAALQLQMECGQDGGDCTPGALISTTEESALLQMAALPTDNRISPS